MGPEASVPSFEDQIRDYRRVQRTLHSALRRILPRRGHQRSLETTLDPDEQLRISSRQRAGIMPAEDLYTLNWTEPRHRVYQHYSEQRIRVTGAGEQVEFSFVTPESYQRLRREGMQHIHIGLMMVRVHAMHRRGSGVRVLLVIRDTRWGANPRSVIGSMEIDLERGTELVYFMPDMMVSLVDFYNHIQIVI